MGNPDRLVIDLAGDGSIQMNIQELATIASYQLPVKIIILNNGYLGMVRQWQELFFEKRYSQVALTNPDFAKLAGSLWIKAYTARKTRRTQRAPPSSIRASRPGAPELPGSSGGKCSADGSSNGPIDQMLGWGET